MTESFNYNQAIQTLESIVERVEKGETDVDELVEMVEQATQIVQKCKAKLKSTEDNLNASLQNLDI